MYADDESVRAAPPYNVIPQHMGYLFGCLHSSGYHSFIKGSVFHDEFKFIHPFMDGNDRTGRLWHSLLLRVWHPVFAWMPVETLIYRSRREYYDAIFAATNAGSSMLFIEFMLERRSTRL